MNSLPLTRRHCLRGLAAGALAWVTPRIHAKSRATQAVFIAAWQNDKGHWVGLIEVQTQAWRVLSSCALPGRAHGLQQLDDGSVLVAARRPGDWLLRWHPAHHTTSWFWEVDDRRFNGHVLTNTFCGQTFFTSETDLFSGQGLVGLRDLHSLKKVDEWPSHGLDPHDMLVLPAAFGAHPAGTLLVANGGIRTHAETGRSKKQLDQMDSSLVALNPSTGRLLGQWRLPDPRLSIRHLAWNTVSKRLGIALQAEHDDTVQRHNAPVLAVWNGTGLSVAAAQPPLQGYGGSIVATQQGGFAVSCPKQNSLVWFDAQGNHLSSQIHHSVCPLAWHQGQVWSAGADQVGVSTRLDVQPVFHATATQSNHHKFDNHWIARH